MSELCPNCGGLIAIRNPTGKCDHLYYPENVPKPSTPKVESDKELLFRLLCRFACANDDGSPKEYLVKDVHERVDAIISEGFHRTTSSVELVEAVKDSINRLGKYESVTTVIVILKEALAKFKGHGK